MAQDARTYERAVSGALLGLVVQVLLGLVLLGLALWTRHPAALAAAWNAASGLPVWLCLLIVFQQHRVERAEALEAERLTRQPGAEGRLFEQSAGDLSLARRRLEHLHRWGVPLAGLLTALYLMGLGVWLLYGVQRFFEQGAAGAAELPEPLLILAVTAGLTFVGFVVSRYLAGMARFEEWRLLRGGAGGLMGSVVVCGLLAASAAARDLGSDIPLKVLSVAVPVFMLILGLEMALNLLLDIYRPRKAGEFARPAFDSRLLGLLTSPESIALTIQEAVNYQFGFEITRSWFWKLLARAVLPLLGLGVLLLLILSCFIVVQPQQQALVLRLGKLARAEPLGPGLHLKLPWPLEAVRLYDATRVQELRIGVGRKEETEAEEEEADEHGHKHKAEEKHSNAVLWGKAHGGHKEELWIVAAPKPGGGTADGAQAAGSLLNAYLPVQWRIKEDGLRDYAKACIPDPKDPSENKRLRGLAEAEITRYFLAHDVDQLLGPGRAKAGAALRQRIQDAADQAQLGVEVVFVGVSGLHPPVDGQVASKFHEPLLAEQERQIMLEEARQFRTRVLTEAAGSVEQAERLLVQMQDGSAPGLSAAEQARCEEALLALLQSAGGQVARRIAEARAFRWTYENAARAEAERFGKELRAQAQAPYVYRQRRYLEVLSEGLAGARKYMLIANRDHLTIRLDLKDTDVELPKVDLSK